MPGSEATGSQGTRCFPKSSPTFPPLPRCPPVWDGTPHRWLPGTGGGGQWVAASWLPRPALLVPSGPSSGRDAPHWALRVPAATSPPTLGDNHRAFGLTLLPNRQAGVARSRVKAAVRATVSTGQVPGQWPLNFENK